MTTETYEGADEAARIFKANTSPRYRRLEWLERWVEGTQYADLPCDWFDDDQPLWERRPCIVYPAVALAIGSYQDLIFGETRFPAFTSRPGEDEEDDEAGLAEEESKLLDRFITKHHALSGFRAYCREGLAAAMGCGTTVGIHGVRAGKPFAELVPAKWCTPSLGLDGSVERLEIRYPYVEEYKNTDGKWAVRVKLYRRVIDPQFDTTYFPADATEDAVEPNWTPDHQQTVEHKLGFCPVVWYAFMKGCQPVNVIDGKTIHGHATDEIHHHDIARSQWHRCALLSEPQVVEIGVQAGYSPTEQGRPAGVPSTEFGGPLPHGAKPAGYYVADPGSGSARKKGPGYVWQYPSDTTKVDVLAMGEDALEAQHTNVSDLRLKVQEELCVVFLDPENIKFAATTSGKALEAIKQKQIDRCGIYRDDLADRFLQPSIDMQLRIAARLGESVRVPLIKKVLPILAKFSGEQAAA